MTWEEIFKNYWDNEDEWKDGIINHLKNNYYPPIKKDNRYVLHKNKCVVVFNGQEFRLEKLTFNILNYIYNKRPNIVSRDEIYENIWKDTIVGERTIDTHVFKIRNTIPNIPLKTIKKTGLAWSE